MAGTIIADDIQHSTAGSVGTEFVVNGSAKSWVNFDQRTSLSTRDSFNTSSVTDNGSGISTSNFSNSFANDDYCFSGNSDGRTGSHFSVPCTDADLNGNAGTYSTSAHKRVTANIGGSPIDFNFISCMYTVDLA